MAGRYWNVTRKEERFQQVEGGGEKIFRYLDVTLFLLSLRGSSKIHHSSDVFFQQIPVVAKAISFVSELV